jgi:uncharacterized protein (DUF433 family)
MHLPEFLTEWPYGEIMLTGHRVSLYHLISCYQQGYTAARLHEEFPTLAPDLIARVLDFYHRNRDEVDGYVARYAEESERRAAATPPAVDREELRRRFEAKKRAGQA